MEDNGRKTIAETLPDTLAIYARLREAQVGELVTYGELAELIGVPDITKRRWLVATARRRAKREHQIVFGVVRNNGLQRLNDSQLANHWSAPERRIRRLTRAELQTLACVQEFDKLSPADQAEHNTGMCRMGLQYQFGSRKITKRIRDAVTAAQATIPVAKMLEMFRG